MTSDGDSEIPRGGHGMAQESWRTAELNVKSFGNSRPKRPEAQQDDSMMAIM